MSQVLGVLGGIDQIVGGIVGGGQAANALKDAGNQLYQNAVGQYTTDAQNLAPYMAIGSQYSNALTKNMGQLSQGFNPTMSQLENSPGYQFELQQGLESTQNGYAARGLGVSGAAMKGAAQFAQGLASTDYTNLANVYNTNRMDTANILTSGANLGLSAAGTLGGLGMQDLGYQQNGLEFAANGKAQGDMAPYQGISNGLQTASGALGGGGGGGGVSSLLGMF